MRRRATTVSSAVRAQRVVDLVKIRRKAKEKLAKELAGKQAETAAIQENESAPESAADTLLREAGAAPASQRTTADAAAKLEAFKERVGRGGDIEVDPDGPTEQKEVQLELLTFLIADEVYAIDIEQIVEIVTPRTPTRVPNAEPGVLGIISLRGTIVTVVDLGRRLSHPALPLTDSSRMIVVARHGETAAFSVDRVLRVVSFSPHALEFAPAVEGAEYHDYIMGVFRQEAALTILLDIDKVLSA